MSKAKPRMFGERPPRAHAYPNPYRFPWLQVLAATIVAVVLFGWVAGSLMISNLDRQIKGSVIDTGGLGAVNGQPDANSGEPLPKDFFEGRPVNILVSGIDSRYNDNGELGAGTTDIDPTIRSDTTLVLHLSADRQNATILSIPRDMKVDIPSCRMADGTITYEYFGMFNSAFSTGAGTDDIAGGIACTQAAVESFTGLTIDGFVVIDFAGFSRLVDTLGGVDICLEEPMFDTAAGLDLPAGCQTLDGTQGLAFARARKEIADGSDMRRIDRQQQLIGLMISQVLDSNMFTNLPSLYQFVQEGLATSKVSVSLDSWRTDAALLNSIKNTPRDQIRFVTVPAIQDPYDENRLLPDDYLAWDVFESIITDQPLPVGTIFRNLENETFVVAEDGQALRCDEHGNPYELDAGGNPIIPDPLSETGLEDSESTWDEG